MVSLRHFLNDERDREPAVKVAVHRLRQRFGGLLREEVAETVARSDQVDDELRHLLKVLQTGQ